MSTTTKPARVCGTCLRVRVVGKTTNHYVCSVTDRVVDHGDTCECWKKKRP